MLYDILPPLLLLASFGGIVTIISRIVMRAQRDQLSQELRAHATSDKPTSPESILQSKGSRVRVMSNRLAAIPGVMKSVTTGARSVVARQRAATARATQQVKERTKQTAPQAKNRLKSLKTGTLSGLQTMKSKAAQVRTNRQKITIEGEGEEQLTPQKEVTEPKKKIRLTRTSSVEKEAMEEVAAATEAENEVNQTPSLSSTVRKMVKPAAPKPKKVGPLQKAADCLRQSQFDKAEDILVPYIVQHTKDAKAYMLLGRAALGRGDWEEALEVFQQVKEIDESAPGLFSALGAAAQEAGKMTLAVESLQKARDLEPSNIEVRKRLLKIAQRTDNRVLKQSVLEELQELRQTKQGQAPAEA